MGPEKRMIGIVGLPRSGTTWLAWVLSLCNKKFIHDIGPVCRDKEEFYKYMGDLGAEGFVDTGIYKKDWFDEIKLDRLVLIARDYRDVQNSLRRKFNAPAGYIRGIEADAERLSKLSPTLVIPFAHLFMSGQVLWEHLFPLEHFRPSLWKVCASTAIDALK